jgi:superoxide reductase
MALPAVSEAAAVSPTENILFTEGDPGHWAEVASIHVPQTSVAGGKLTITTPHPQSADHYIVSHTAVLGEGVFLNRKTFAYTDAPTSEHVLPAGYTGPITVTSTCNLHDVWAKTITV